MNETEQRSVVLSRELPFARERIWTAMTHPDHVNRWWGPDGFRNEDVAMDFRVGGLWSYTMVGPDGTRYPNRVWFKEIAPVWGGGEGGNGRSGSFRSGWGRRAVFWCAGRGTTGG